ncbi:MAG TPA: hypothetical protein VJ792_00405 [Candidatus Nitrosotalea sp.]|nr:hypothetical protein [Candidatus Nitrosotalea sp.]
MSLLGGTIAPVLGDRSIDFEKTVDVKRAYLIESMTNYTNYPNIFRGTINSASLVSNNTVQIQGAVGLFSFKELVTPTTLPNGSYEIDVVSGELQGTKITSTFVSTWGFDGTPNGGTLVKTSLSLEAPSWLTSVALSMVSDDQIKSSMDSAIYRFSLNAKNLQSSNITK